MGLLGWPGLLLGKSFPNFSKGGLVASVGGYVAGKFLERQRQKWENAEAVELDTLLEHITTYDLARGAGRLLKGWFVWNAPKRKTPSDLAGIEKQVDKLLAITDQNDASPEEQALNRLLVSKALFSLEGFKLGHGAYEKYQQDALILLRKNPKWRKLSREDIFRGRPFQPEEVIGATHRLLFTLAGKRIADYISHWLEKTSMRDDTDYMARLIALTLGVEDETEFSEVIGRWFEAYREFKLAQCGKRESWVNDSLKAASGGMGSLLNPLGLFVR